MSLSPVILFTYNRPEHTRKTIEALAQNAHAEETILIVFSDGPESMQDVEKMNAVRSYLESITGFAGVVLRFRSEHHGVASSIIDGVTQVVEEYGKAIVLEDDLITSPWFLSYMNQALNYYQDDDKVMHVGGYMYPIDPKGLPQTFFSRHVSSWGWGTWSRAWQMLQPSVEQLICCFDDEKRQYLNFGGVYDFYSHLEKNLKGELNTWAIRWYASVALNGGLSLYPSTSLIENIGLDGSGTHCGRTPKYGVEIRQQQIMEFPDVIIENLLALKRIKHFLCNVEPFGVRLKQKLRNFLAVSCRS